MRWAQRKEQAIGETRLVRKFALWPTKVYDQWVWLEYYNSHQKFEEKSRSWSEFDRSVGPLYEAQEYEEIEAQLKKIRE